jgi:uncharacterized protein YjbI with pentapeptide repeats
MQPLRFMNKRDRSGIARAALHAAAFVGMVACDMPSPYESGERPTSAEGTDLQGLALSGENLAGSNLAGSNLAGSNLAGSNLAGANLGGDNLAGSNLAGSNLAGTNLGGNNLAGSNLAGSNLAGSNLAGSNLAGSNLAGSNLAGSNLAGSNLAGSNLAGNNLAGSNLAGSNLAGSNSGVNIHGVADSGMLYSREDVWSPKTGQCIVMGIGSTAFPKLLGQQSANAKISVALGRLPWGFATTSGGPITLQAWEAVVWGDKTYCVFVLVAPPATSWPGVAGFIKAVFRWNAPPTQSMDISGIEASAAIDPTLRTDIATYSGMMDARAKFSAGRITDRAFVAGELAFVTATTNNEAVMVDFSAWVVDSGNNPLVLGNVQPAPPPTHAEALYVALDNGDGTVSVILDDAASRTRNMPLGMTNSVVGLFNAYRAWQDGLGPKPVPRRCGGALFLNTQFGEPVPTGKCDNGLTWAPGFCIKGSNPWSAVSGTTAPMNGYMELTQPGGLYKRALMANNSCGVSKLVLSEIYVHMWEPSYDLPVSGSCVPESDTGFCARLGNNCGSLSGTDNCGAARTVSSCGSCASPLSCGGEGEANVCGNANIKSFEAETTGNTIVGEAYRSTCPQAYSKLGAISGSVAGACSAGGKVKYVGNGSANHVIINKVTVPAAGSYPIMVYGWSKDTRSFSMSVNGGSASTLSMGGPDWNILLGVATKVNLNAGANTIKLSNSTAYAPDFDRVTVTTGACAPESNTTFCARQGKVCGSVTVLDNCGNSRTVSSCGGCTTPYTCGGAGTPNVCGMAVEAEGSGHTLSGTAAISTCTTSQSCSGGKRVKAIGSGSSNYIILKNFSVPVAGSYTVAFYGYADGSKHYNMVLNGTALSAKLILNGTLTTRIMNSITLNLNAGSNTLKLYNASYKAPELDRITITGVF